MKFKIIEEVYESGQIIYRVKRRHPLIPIWMYIGRAADRMFFTTLNHYQTAYYSFEAAQRRVMHYRDYIIHTRDPVPIKKRICKEINY